MTEERKPVQIEGFGAFSTRDLANEGIEVPLMLATGELTDQKLRLRGQESDEWRVAYQEAQRALMASYKITAGLKPDTPAAEKAAAERKRLEAEMEIELKLTAAHLMGWTDKVWPGECTPENALAFLRTAPQVAKYVRIMGAEDALFFGVGSSKLLGTPKPSSDSTSSSPEPSQPSENTSPK